MRTLPWLTLLAIACAGSPEPTDEVSEDTGTSTSPGQQAAVLTTVAADYSTGSFATIALDDWEVADELFVTSGDPALSVSGASVYQINRYGFDTLRRYEPGSWTAPAWERELADGSNPHAAAECAGVLFISLYETATLAVHDIDSGNLLGTVDLSEQADGDGVGPEPSSMVVLGDRLYVGLERLDRNTEYWSTVGGQVVEVDCESRSVAQTWDAAGSASVHAWDADRLLVLSDAFGDDPGGIYALEPGGDGLTHLLDVPGEALSSIAAVGDHAIATSTASDYSHFGRHCIDLGAAEVTSSETGTTLFGAVAANDRSEAWVALGPSWLDASAPTGVMVYDLESCEAKTSTPIATSLPPNAVSFY